MDARILVSKGGKHFYVRDTGTDFHSQFGLVSKEDLKKARDGDCVRTNTGKELFIFSPFFIDSFRRIRRGPQIIPLKDVASIIATSGIGKESIVIDAGTGSGALACFIANFAKHVYSYEIREDFHGIASQNAKSLGLKNITLKNKDVHKGIDEKDVDAVILDLADPWNAVESAAEALKPGGFLISYSPTTPQVSDFVAAVEKSNRFIILKTTEIMEREWEASERKVRPKSAAIGHSGFLTFARKIC